MIRTTPTSATYSDEVQNQEHLDAIKRSWEASTDQGSKATGKPPKTPEALRKMHQLLRADGEPLYSVHAIAKALEKVTSPKKRSGLVVPDASNVSVPLDDAFVTDRRPDKLAPPKPEPFRVECPALAAATNGDGQIWIHEFSWSAVMSYMQDVSATLGDKVLLFYNPPQEAGFSAILNERAFQLTSRHGTFELRTAIPTPTKASPSLQSHEEERKVGQRLSFESIQTVSSNASSMQAQLKYEREVRKTLTNELEKRFPTKIPSSPLETMLDSIHHIQKVWTTFLRDEDNAVDGIESRKKRLWFMEICLTRLDEAAQTKWRHLSADKQEASYYPTLEAFLRQLFEATIPRNALKKPSDLIEGLSSSISRASLDSWESLLALVAVQVQRAAVLGKFTPGADQAVLDNAELKFWATILTPQAKDELAATLYLHEVVAQAPSQLSREFTRTSRFDLYPLEAVRAALYARADRETPWDLDILWPGGAAGGHAGKQSARGQAAVPYATRSSPAAGHTAASLSKEEPNKAGLSFISGLDGTRVKIPVRHLKDEPSYSLRQKYEAEYLKHQVFPKAVCQNSKCQMQGHTLYVCPRLSRCNEDGVEQNPRSFFRGLHLPKVLQTLPRGETGRHVAAPVLMVAPSAPTLSAVNLQEAFSSQEFQAALQTAIQANRQPSGDMGNGRAGAGI